MVAVFSTYTANDWLEGGTAGDAKNDGEREISRALNGCLGAQNLLILAGLGTSLSVVDGNNHRRAPTMADLWAAAPACSANFPALLANVNYVAPAGGGDIEALLSNCKLAERFLAASPALDAVKTFVTAAESMIVSKCSFVSDADTMPAHTELLRRVARRSERKSRTKIFTTNYDLCFEAAAHVGRFILIDGFTLGHRPVFDAANFSYDFVRRDAGDDASAFLPNVAKLFKLHGSIDWSRDKPSGEICRRLPAENPVLIFPRHTKYELAFAHPYIEMMGAFQSALREPNTALIVVGFGFRDDHLAEPILSALRSNLGLKVVICDPALTNAGAQAGIAQSNPPLSKIKKMIEQGDARLALLNCRFEDLVIRIPDIAAQTDYERHVERMRAAHLPNG